MISERGFCRVLGVRIGRDAAPVVAHRDMAVFVQLDLDPGGVACDRFVHRIVDDLGDHMVQGAVVLATDIHAGAQAHVFHVFEHLNRGGVVVGFGGCA